VGAVSQPVVVAVDGGGSKTDVVALNLDGTVVGRARGLGSSPHFIGVEPSVDRINGLVREAVQGRPIAQANVYLSGLDLPSEVSAYRDALGRVDWFGESGVVENDLYALLRAGTAAPDAVAVVCGTGINAIGRRVDGAIARFAALGMISGDWGGGIGIGESALWSAVRAADLRGPATSLATSIPPVYGLETLENVTEAIHFGRLDYAELGKLAPLVLQAADAGDEVAAQLVDRQGEEIGLMAASCIDRLDLAGVGVPVVLGGGVLASGDARLWNAVRTVLAERAPLAVATALSGPPILGAALLTLESAGAVSSVLERARREWSDA
jgi:N-acetylglucosamine kinase-like BadF-type ATPase